MAAVAPRGPFFSSYREWTLSAKPRPPPPSARWLAASAMHSVVGHRQTNRHDWPRHPNPPTGWPPRPADPGDATGLDTIRYTFDRLPPQTGARLPENRHDEGSCPMRYLSGLILLSLLAWGISLPADAWSQGFFFWRAQGIQLTDRPARRRPAQRPVTDGHPAALARATTRRTRSSLLAA